MKELITYATDPTKRCRKCGGREVKTFVGNLLLDVNLKQDAEGYICKYEKECQQNIEAENTQVIVSNRGYTIMADYTTPLMEVEFADEKMMWERDEFDKL